MKKKENAGRHGACRVVRQPPMAYYNDTDPFATEWLVNLMRAGHVSRGMVERRSIADVMPEDVLPHARCHFFAGIGGWDIALRLAGWPEDAPVWTGSCPCQPFSQAGRRKGTSDERHLWPEWFRLIRECRPPIVFGEQVASPDGLKWLDAVSADLEGAGYAFGAADLCAASVGAPHIRQRLYFVAVADGERREGLSVLLRQRSARQAVPQARGRGEIGELVHAAGPRREQAHGAGQTELPPALTLEPGRQGDAGPWSDVEWLPCQDGKSRPTKRGIFPLAHGVPARVGKLRAYGNAIVPQVAATFVRATMDL
jgi:DNA (cytosine-5)-methyltransferase 1